MVNKEHYAFDTMRPLQLEIIDRINEAFDNGFKYVAIEIPTGGGKSGMIMSIALNWANSYINTSSKLLQDQYLRDFDFIHTIKGKNNFNCIDPNLDSRITDLKADGGACCFKSNYKCEVKPKKDEFIAINRGSRKGEVIIGPKGMCPYFTQKYEALAAGHAISNYRYFFSLLFYTGELMPRNLLVFDEAHNIENEVLDFISITLNADFHKYYVKELFDDFLKDNVTVPEFPQGQNDDINLWLSYLRETKIWMGQVWDYYDDEDDEEEDRLSKDQRKVLTRFEGVLNKVKYLVSIIEQDPTNWVIDFKKEGFNSVKGVKITPIETGKYIKPIFDMGQKVLFASATLLDKEVFASMIGVSPDEIIFIRVEDSPFPKENRPIYAENLGAMSQKTMDTLLPIIAERIDELLDKHKDDKGIIHVTNYKQSDYIKKHLRNKHRLTSTVTGMLQSDILDIHKRKPKSVLISPSMMEGVDLKDDVSRFQIVVKMPFMDLGDKRISIKQKRSWKWYNWYTVLRLVQMIGRSIRHDKDYAVTYVLDSKFNDITNNRVLPKYVREAVIKK